MGYIFCKKKEKLDISFRYEKFQNGKTKTFKDKNEFSLSKTREKSYQLFQQISNIKEYQKKINQFENILSINNIDENIIFDYLLLLKQNEIDIYHKKLNEYLLCLSNEKYYQLENKKKQYNSKDYMKEFFKKIYEFDDMSYKERLDFYYYLKDVPKDYVININFTEKENPELYLYFLFENIFYIFKNELNKYSSKIIKSNESFNDKLNQFIDKEYRKIILEFDDLLKIDETLILYSRFFDTLTMISSFLKNIYDDINMTLDEKDIDFYYLEGILLIIKDEIQYNNKVYKKNDKLLQKYFNNNNIKYDVNKLNLNYKRIRISIKNKDLEIYSKFNDNLIAKIENYHIYNNLESSFKDLDLFALSANEQSIKYYLIDDIKLQFFQENNYVKYSLEFIHKFHKKISNSKTMNSLINYLYPGYEEGKFLSNDFLLSIFEESLNKAKFYPFDTSIFCTTFYHSLNINYQIPNKLKQKESIKNFHKIFFKYIIANLSFFIICEYHEGLGHYITEYLNYLTLMDYKSPRDENNIKESGTYIQILLFGNKLDFNLYEMIYILDSNNYNVDYKDFKKNFLELSNNNKYEPSKYFKEDFGQAFGYDFNTINEEIKRDFDENDIYHLFGDLKGKETKEVIRFEINRPCSLNIRDIIKNKSKEKDVIYEKLKKNYDLYQEKLKKNNY